MSIVIKSFWNGNELSLIEQLSINSYLKNGHEFHLYSYSNIDNIPNGAILLDANDIISGHDVFLDGNGTWAGFSNWFRYKLLYEKGGWWSDLDVICLKKLSFKDDFCFSTERIPSKEGDDVVIMTTSLIKSAKNSEYLLNLLNYIDNIDKTFVKWGSLGPKLFHSILCDYDFSEYIYTPDVFCPINWNEIDLLFSPTPPKIPNESYTIHLWNEMWRRRSIDKNSNFDPNCIIERYKDKYM